MSDSTERLGQLLVRMGALTQEQVAEILEYQKDHPDILFGQIAVKLGYITREKLDKFL
jgi:hypothetical protein